MDGPLGLSTKRRWFSCQTATSGHLYDLVIAVIGLYKFVKASLSGMFLPAKTKQS